MTTNPPLRGEDLEEYLYALNASAALVNSGRLHSSVMSFSAQRCKKYVKVWCMEDGRRSSIHAFVEIATGDLVKAAGLNQPQRNSDGTLSVRFHLADDEERRELCTRLSQDPQAFSGGYLYLQK